MLAGQVNALLLQPPEFCAHVSRVAAAANDLATLVLQPSVSRQGVIPSAKPQQHAAATAAWMLQQQRQEADACVLQLMLGCRVLELLAAFVIYIGVHVCRLVQLQQQLAAGGCGRPTDCRDISFQPAMERLVVAYSSSAQLCRWANTVMLFV